MPIDHSRKSRSSRLQRVFSGALAGLAGAACSGPYPQSTLDPVSEFGAAIDNLFVGIFWWAVVVFVVVEGLLLFTIIKFRAQPGRPKPKFIHGHTLLEITWTLAPAVILVLIAVPTIRTIFEHDGSAPDNALVVEVVGHQWWWEYRYPEYGIVTATEMHIPRGRPIALEMTSADVIHSFWIPRLGGKRDVLMGRVSRLAFTADSTGRFLGQCAEFCGESHANMRTTVVVEELAEFEAWVAGQTTTPSPIDSLSPLERRGAEEFTRVRDPASNSCMVCHAVAGVSFGVLGPNLTHLASRRTIAGGILESGEEGLRRWLRDPPGAKPGSLMPRIDLTEEEIDALVAYLRALD